MTIGTYILSLDIGVRSLSEESRHQLRRGTLRSEVERSKSRICQSIRIPLATERKQFRKDNGILARRRKELGNLTVNSIHGGCIAGRQFLRKA